MSCGNEFVETLKTLGYPRAALLSGADFDWLFETPADAAFLGWFCGGVSARNVLAEAELRAFEALQRAGRPLLDGAALDEALRTCAARGGGAPGGREGGGAAELARLEEEVRALRALRALKLRRRDRCQLLASAASARLGAREEAAAAGLKRGRVALGAARAELGAALQAAGAAGARLVRLLRGAGGGQGPGPPPPPPPLPSRLALQRYLGREEQSTAALTAFARERFFQGAHEVVESSNEDNFQLVDVQAASLRGHPGVLEERRREMARLRLAHACAQHQLVRWRARNCGLAASVEWAERTLRSLGSKAVGEDAWDAKISNLNGEILKLAEEITYVKDKSLPAVVKENAQMLNMPVVKGDFDLQIAKQDCYSARQALVLNQLIKQKASFELLQLMFEIELRKHWDIYRQLESLVQELSQSNTMLHQRLEMLADPSVSQQTNPRNTIEAKDFSTHRLYQLLEGETKKKELFLTQGNLEKAAQKLKQDVSLTQNELELSVGEHSLFLSKLNNDVDMLCDALYQGRKQLLLSDQELTEQFHQVESQLNKLNHLFTDVLADVKTKRKMLASNKLLQMERKLYVYFLKNENYLKDIVENLENQSKMKTLGLED